jgi:hypothetical protein
MRMLSFIGVLTTLCWLATSASAQSFRDTSGDLINPGKAINESRSNADIQLGVEQGITQGTYRAPASEPENQGNHWRYRFQNSQWWYYQPNKQWVVWNGKSWVEPPTMVPNHTSANQQQPYQSGYRGTQGMNPQPAMQAAPVKPQSPATVTPNTNAAKPLGNQTPPTTPSPPATK